MQESNHRDICIVLSLGGRELQAVGYLERGEKSVLGRNAIARVDTEGKVLKTDEDWLWVFTYKDELRLGRRDFHWLATARPNKEAKAGLSGLYLRADERGGPWMGLDSLWHREGLILRWP